VAANRVRPTGFAGKHHKNDFLIFRTPTLLERRRKKQALSVIKVNTRLQAHKLKKHPTNWSRV